ncbi:MAG TPA: hypothetical protein VEL79_00480, partial [Vicinamibacterales bacterium]|nr:hypothetical protein [Vicinamibacterales bacterium]
HQMDDREHPRVLEEAGRRPRVDGDRRERQEERDVREASIEDGQQARRQPHRAILTLPLTAGFPAIHTEIRRFSAK